MGECTTILINGLTIYLNWMDRETALEVLQKALPKFRNQDPDYATARLVGHFHNATGGDDEHLSMGLWPATEHDGPHDFSIDLAGNYIRSPHFVDPIHFEPKGT